MLTPVMDGKDEPLKTIAPLELVFVVGTVEKLKIPILVPISLEVPEVL